MSNETTNATVSTSPSTSLSGRSQWNRLRNQRALSTGTGSIFERIARTINGDVPRGRGLASPKKYNRSENNRDWDEGVVEGTAEQIKNDGNNFTLKGFLKKRLMEEVNMENVFKFGFHRFRLTTNHSTSAVFNFLSEHSFKLTTNTTDLTNHVDYKFGTGHSFAYYQGVYFFMMAGEGNTRGEDVVYVPFWQRDKGLEVLRQILADAQPVCTIGGRVQINPELANQRQFWRDEDYTLIRSKFERLVNNPNYYLDNDKRLKETILLYGAPGTGKSNMIKHLAAVYQLNIYPCSPGTFAEGIDGEIYDSFKNSGRPFIILMEDVDSTSWLRLSRGEDSDGYEVKPAGRDKHLNNATLKQQAMAAMAGGKIRANPDYSRFINALDGIEGLHNVIVVMTTNYNDQLMPSIHRRGRVDTKFEVVPLSTQEIAGFVDTPFKETIASYPEGSFAISDIIDLRNASTEEEIEIISKGW